jgi:hypothetical protein
MSFSTTSSSPLLGTPSGPLIHTSQPNAYWCGRFQALNDRKSCDRVPRIHFSDTISELLILGFYNEALEVTLQDPNMLRQYIEEATPSPRANYNTFGKSKSKQTHTRTESEEMEDIQNSCSQLWKDTAEKRLQRVFLHLQAQCVTAEAKHSLWEWQLAYARIEKNKKLLPARGKMTDDMFERTGWVSRVGKVFMGSKYPRHYLALLQPIDTDIGPGSDSSPGRRTGFGLGRRKDTSLDGTPKRRRHDNV